MEEEFNEYKAGEKTYGELMSSLKNVDSSERFLDWMRTTKDPERKTLIDDYDAKRKENADCQAAMGISAAVSLGSFATYLAAKLVDNYGKKKEENDDLILDEEDIISSGM